MGRHLYKMFSISEEDLPKFLNVLDPNIIANIDHYKNDYYYIFPKYHGCDHKNRNGTRKKID